MQCDIKLQCSNAATCYWKSYLAVKQYRLLLHSSKDSERLLGKAVQGSHRFSLYEVPPAVRKNVQPQQRSKWIFISYFHKQIQKHATCMSKPGQIRQNEFQRLGLHWHETLWMNLISGNEDLWLLQRHNNIQLTLRERQKQTTIIKGGVSEWDAENQEQARDGGSQGSCL